MTYTFGGKTALADTLRMVEAYKGLPTDWRLFCDEISQSYGGIVRTEAIVLAAWSGVTHNCDDNAIDSIVGWDTLLRARKHYGGDFAETSLTDDMRRDYKHLHNQYGQIATHSALVLAVLERFNDRLEPRSKIEQGWNASLALAELYRDRR